MDSIPTPVTGDRYVVVARRYRPKGFEELIGQETVAQALTTAIRSGRVGHAYLFTGARGVGKTSTARIFAKALNAPGGPTPSPDLDSDIAQAIDAGEDIDVIEIDGASNRGIDEIRQLRSNVNVRPSRSRYKIYIIDEVHMLTTQAFNALLKTLEEPPEHVKFIFCTTDPDKIPITVLSRCQRFDFAPVHTQEIFQRLKFICDHEGRAYEEAALQVIARRAAGSMRDSQSLLEQLLSFCSGTLTLQSVHEVLGTADEELLSQLAHFLFERDQAGILKSLEQASARGIDLGLLAEQLLGYLRDILVLAVGGSSELLRTANPENAATLSKLGHAWGSPTLMAAIQILDESLVKMRYSTQNRILLEVALLQVCQLQDLARISQVLTMLERPDTSLTQPKSVPANLATAAEKKNDEELVCRTIAEECTVPPILTATTEESIPASAATGSTIRHAEQTSHVQQSTIADTADPLHVDPATDSGSELSDAEPSWTPMQCWLRAASQLEGLLQDFASMVESIAVDSAGRWEVVLPHGAELVFQELSKVPNRLLIAKSLQREAGREVHWSYRISMERKSTAESSPGTPVVPLTQRRREVAVVPLVRKILETFGGDIIRIDGPVEIVSELPPISPSHQKEIAANV